MVLGCTQFTPPNGGSVSVAFHRTRHTLTAALRYGQSKFVAASAAITTHDTPSGLSAAIRAASASVAFLLLRLNPCCAACPIAHAPASSGAIDASPPSFE